MLRDNMIYLIVLICVIVCVKDTETQNCDFDNECSWRADKGFIVTSYLELLQESDEDMVKQLGRSRLGENKGRLRSDRFVDVL